MKDLCLYTGIIFLLTTTSLYAQFLDKLDIGVSYGFMRSYNKASIVNDTFKTTEEPVNTRRLSFSLAYKFNSKHSMSVGYSLGKVGSTITGTIRSGSDTGSFTNLMLSNARNLLTYKSINLSYSYTYPIGSNNLITSIGLQRQENGIEDSFIVASGIIRTNYNASLSVGIKQKLYSSISFIPKFTIINSIKNNSPAESNSSFVPIQIGFELGLRIGFEGAE